MPPNKYLRLKAGKNAYQKVLSNNLRKEDIRVMAAAAAGPKWLILYELDKFLINEFLPNHPQKIHFAGGSIGSWRAASYCVEDAPQAIDRLHHAYVHQSYSDAPFGDEVSDGIKNIIEEMLGKNGFENLQNPTDRLLHISTSRATFKTNGKISLYQKMKFVKPYFVNIFNRKNLGRYIERVMFTNAPHPIFKPDGLKSTNLSISKENLINALCASGSIPFYMNPIVMDGYEHWDGGAADYHMALDYDIEDGLVFFPHYRDHINPGWFDKYWPYRTASPELLKNTVMLYPTEEFIQLLPEKKLTSTDDFFNHEDEERIAIWKKVSELGKLLVEDFQRILDGEVEENLSEF